MDWVTLLILHDSRFRDMVSVSKSSPPVKNRCLEWTHFKMWAEWKSAFTLQSGFMLESKQWILMALLQSHLFNRNWLVQHWPVAGIQSCHWHEQRWHWYCMEWKRCSSHSGPKPLHYIYGLTLPAMQLYSNGLWQNSSSLHCIPSVSHKDALRFPFTLCLYDMLLAWSQFTCWRKYSEDHALSNNCLIESISFHWWHYEWPRGGWYYLVQSNKFFFDMALCYGHWIACVSGCTHKR